MFCHSEDNHLGLADSDDFCCVILAQFKSMKNLTAFLVFTEVYYTILFLYFRFVLVFSS